MSLKSRIAIGAGAVALLVAGAAYARTASDCCCKDDCCDEATAPATPAPAPSGGAASR